MKENMEHSFLGRKQIVDLIKRRVSDLKEGYRQNIALIGCLHVGKSTVLQSFLEGFDDSAVGSVYLDLENRDLDYFVIKTCRSILHHFCRIKGLELHEDIAKLSASARGHIPATVDVVSSALTALEKGRAAEAFDMTLSLPETLAQECGLKTVIIYDEFQSISGMGVPEAFRRLADHITTQKHSLYILASSFQEQAARILEEELTLLFGSFELVHLLPLDLNASLEFIERRLGGVKLSPTLRSFLADFTGGRPLYLDIISQELINLAAIYKQQEVYAPLLAQAVENLLFNRWGALSRHFELCVERLCAGKNNRLVTTVLFFLADGVHKLKDIVASCGAKQTQVSARLNFLAGEGVVEKNGPYFHIKDKLMAYWIRYIFQKRIKSIELEPGKQRDEFRAAILKDINEFQSNCRKDLSSRVIELLNCFENEHLNLYGRSYKLPMFKEAKSLRMGQSGGQGFDVIQAEADDGAWLLVLRKDPLAEKDISGVVEEVRKMGIRMRKCVLVPFSGIDDTARLCALNERMWIWNEPVLNSLMSLYGKSYIVP